jgi:hypothetical protein
MDWFFDGLGTLLIGLVVGGAGGSAVTWRITKRTRSTRQSQRAGGRSTQTQVGRDLTNG